MITMTKHARFSVADGTAALGICESLLIALTDLKVITERDARDLLTDVATSHQEAAAQSATPNKHDAVVAIVHRILAAKNGVRD
jgi:hypothetical protein